MAKAGKLRGGVIGLGFMGRHHIAQYEQMPDVEIVAIADADPARLGNGATVGGNIPLPAPTTDLRSLQAFDDGRALIAKADVDFVDVCTPTDLHAGLAVLAAEAGRHVVVEKPMALSSAEADRMIAAARRNGVELMVAQCVRFWPEYAYLRDTVQRGSLGKLLKAEFTRRSSQPIWSWQDWMNDAHRSGGAILDLHIHDVDYVNHLLGLPDRIYAVGVRTPATGGYDLVSALYTYNNGPVVSIEAAWYTPPGYPFGATFQAILEGGMVRYDGHETPTLTVLRNGAAEPEAPIVSGDPYCLELAYFVDCVRRGQSPAEFLPPESSRASLQLIEAEIASITSGAPVAPPVV